MSNNTITKGEITNGEDAIDESIMNDMKDIFQEIDQAELELAKQQVKLFTPIYEKQRKVFERIPKFWAQALTKNSLIAQSLSYDDYEVVQNFSLTRMEKKLQRLQQSIGLKIRRDFTKEDDGDQCFFRWVAGDSIDDMNWEIGGIIKDDFFPQAWKKFLMEICEGKPSYCRGCTRCICGSQENTDIFESYDILSQYSKWYEAFRVWKIQMNYNEVRQFWNEVHMDNQCWNIFRCNST
nr:14195_t:CDS:2 [Entrophospora candida]